jgi:hypothetical protein
VTWAWPTHHACQNFANIEQNRCNSSDVFRVEAPQNQVRLWMSICRWIPTITSQKTSVYPKGNNFFSKNKRIECPQNFRFPEELWSIVNQAFSQDLKKWTSKMCYRVCLNEQFIKQHVKNKTIFFKKWASASIGLNRSGYLKVKSQKIFRFKPRKSPAFEEQKSL